MTDLSKCYAVVGHDLRDGGVKHEVCGAPTTYLITTATQDSAHSTACDDHLDACIKAVCLVYGVCCVTKMPAGPSRVGTVVEFDPAKGVH